MPGIFLTVLSAILLVYADLQSWPVVALVAVVCVGSTAASLALEKYSAYASGLVAGSLIVCDALSRHYETSVSSLHDSVTLGDLSYAVCLFAIAGWVAGWLLRRKHVMPKKMEIIDSPRATFVISPAFSRRRIPRPSNQ
ncbi:MAG: hypothetical protein ACM3JB_27450 [Acidobacteriaceae bacterium]